MLGSADVVTRHDGLSRRDLLRGAAWAAPLIILATAAPAAAASGPPPAFRGGLLYWNGQNWSNGAHAAPFMDCSSMAAGSAYAPGEVRIVISAPVGSHISSLTVTDAPPPHRWIVTPADPVGASTAILMNSAPIAANTWVNLGNFAVTIDGAGPVVIIAQPTGLAAPLAP